MYRKGKFCVVLAEMLIGRASMEHSMEVPQKMKSRTIIYHPAILFLGFLSEEDKTLTQKDIFIPVFTAVLFTIVKTWK